MPKRTRKPSQKQRERQDARPFAHASGRWAKKCRGQFVYLGHVRNDPSGDAAWEEWLRIRDDARAGRKPKPKVDDALTVEELANLYLDARKQQVQSGELSNRTWMEYRNLLAIVVEYLGRNRAAADIEPDDWAGLRGVFAKRWGPSRLANSIVYVRSVWKWGHENKKLAEKASFGSGFSVPSAKVNRGARNAKGPRMFKPEELRAILKVADTNTKAITLLAINCAMGPTDLALLPITAIDVESGWLDYPRRKTQVSRRVPLWDKTLDAIREVLATRPDPKKGFADVLLLDRTGKGYAGTRGNHAIWRLFTKTAKAAGVEGRTPYDCRRTFLTVAERSKDPVAISAIMGHVAASSDMSSVYRQHIDDDRLRAVVDVVRSWLFGDDPTEDDDDSTDGEPLTIAIQKARKSIKATSGPVQDTLKMMWLPEITAALQGDVEAEKRVLATWGTK